MKANPNKFQGFTITDNENVSLSLADTDIQIDQNIKLLGLNIDDKLNFDFHIS